MAEIETTGQFLAVNDELVLGVEIGHGAVRLALVDPIGVFVVDAIERPVAMAAGPRDPRTQEQYVADAITAGLGSLGGGGHSPSRVAATIGFANSGVGSGSSITGWLDSLSADLGEPVVAIGEPGVSYTPLASLDFAQRVFDRLALRLTWLELAPVALARTLGEIEDGAVIFGSGIAWQARVVNGEVLEAFEDPEGSSGAEPVVKQADAAVDITELVGATVDEQLCRERGFSLLSLGPAVGAVLGSLSNEGVNLLGSVTVHSPESSSPGAAGPTNGSPRPRPNTAEMGVVGKSNTGRHRAVSGLASAKVPPPLSRERRPSGQYAALNDVPLADDETLREQYAEASARHARLSMEHAEISERDLANQFFEGRKDQFFEGSNDPFDAAPIISTAEHVLGFEADTEIAREGSSGSGVTGMGETKRGSLSAFLGESHELVEAGDNRLNSGTPLLEGTNGLETEFSATGIQADHTWAPPVYAPDSPPIHPAEVATGTPNALRSESEVETPTPMSQRRARTPAGAPKEKEFHVPEFLLGALVMLSICVFIFAVWFVL